MKIESNETLYLTGSHYCSPGMSVEELLPQLKQNGAKIKQSILEVTYRPSPVRSVEIPESEGNAEYIN